MSSRISPLLGTALLAAGAAAHATDWSDNSVGYRYGTRFAEPYTAGNIAKHIVNFTHADGYRYGTNYFSVDGLLSNRTDPAAPGSEQGAKEVYAVYRHTLDIGKISGTDLKAGPFRGFGLTLGADANAKNDAGYNSRKRMLVAGPTAMLDVPGFFNISLLQLWESNAPYNKFTGVRTGRYDYDPHPMLNLAWGIPIESTRLSFSGYANFIAAKGRDEFGGATKPETNIDMALMYDARSLTGTGAKTFLVGVGYQYWKNKFGNDHKGPAGGGAFARTPMVRAEYYF